METVVFDQLSDAMVIMNKLKQLWNERHEQVGVFRYKLNVERRKILAGPLQILVEVSMLYKEGFNLFHRW